MNPNICNNCGGDFEYRNGRWVCRACGSYKPEELSNEEVTLLYTAYQKLRLADFDQAEQEFDDIIQKYPRNPHGYWGRLMSKYGIKYEEDFDGRMIPTCYATSIESILSATDYQKALQFADAENKAYFTKQAEYIERVRKEWVEKARKEKPYDIFISYKDSDLANGIERTKDSYAVQELYIHLTRKGYRVFFSRESLRDKAGEKYEPYIFSALSSAKVMLVYGSKPEYITSTWLKNEWMRYEKRIRLGEKHPNSLLVARDGFSPYELPKALSSRQGFDATQRSFYSDLEEAIEHILHDKTKIAAAPKATKPKKGRKALVLIVSTILIAATTGVAGFLMLANKEPPAGPPITTDGTSNTTIEPTTDEPLTDELTSNTEAELVSKREPENETDPAPETESESETQPEIEPHIHVYGEWTENQSPTCVKVGERSRSCTCGDTQTEVVPTTDHNYSSTFTAPTATEDGYEKYTCSMCGNSYTETVIPRKYAVTSTSSDMFEYTGTSKEHIVISAVFERGGYWYRVVGIEDFFYSNVTSVTLPDSINTVRGSAFRFCANLTEIVIGQDNQRFCSIDGILYNKNGSTLVCYPAGRNETVYTISNSVTTVGDGAFWGNANLASVTIPDGVTSIEDSSFNSCVNLISVTIPNSVKNIGYATFIHCSNLADIRYAGTQSEWEAISKGNEWDSDTGSYTIHCTDGDIIKE